MAVTLEVLEPVDVKEQDDGDQRFHSVTTLTGILDKPAFRYSDATKISTAAIRSERVWKAILEHEGEDEARKWLEGARFRMPRGERSDTQMGIDVHKAFEEYVITGVRPDRDPELVPYLDQLDRWFDLFQPDYLAAESTVYSPEYGYAGTLDAILTIDGVRFIADYKTSKKSFDKRGDPTGPYPEVALQLAAYRYAEFAAVWRPRRFEQMRRRYYLLSEAERAMAVPVPKVDTGLAIHVTPEHCHAHPVKCDEEIFECFLAIADAARFTFDLSKSVIGEPLVR